MLVGAKIEIFKYLDSNILKFVTIRRNLFSATSEWWIFIASKTFWFEKYRKNVKYSKRRNCSVDHHMFWNFRRFWSVYSFSMRFFLLNSSSKFFIILNRQHLMPCTLDDMSWLHYYRWTRSLRNWLRGHGLCDSHWIYPKNASTEIMSEINLTIKQHKRPGVMILSEPELFITEIFSAKQRCFCFSSLWNNGFSALSSADSVLIHFELAQIW